MRFWLRQLYFNSCPETEQGKEKQEKYGRVDLSFWTVSYFHWKKINLKGFSLWDLGLMRNEAWVIFKFSFSYIFNWSIFMVYFTEFHKSIFIPIYNVLWAYPHFLYCSPLLSLLRPHPCVAYLVFLDNLISSSCHIHMHNFIYLYKI